MRVADRPIGIVFVELDDVVGADVPRRGEAAERHADQVDEVVAREVRLRHARPREVDGVRRGEEAVLLAPWG